MHTTKAHNANAPRETTSNTDTVEQETRKKKKSHYRQKPVRNARVCPVVPDGSIHQRVERQVVIRRLYACFVAQICQLFALSVPLFQYYLLEPLDRCNISIACSPPSIRAMDSIAYFCLILAGCLFCSSSMVRSRLRWQKSCVVACMQRPV